MTHPLPRCHRHRRRRGHRGRYRHPIGRGRSSGGGRGPGPGRCRRYPSRHHHRRRRADACRLDVGDQASRAELVAGVLDRHGRIDVLVSCARRPSATRGSEPDRTDTASDLGGEPQSARSRWPARSSTDDVRGGGSIINIASRAWLRIFRVGVVLDDTGALVGVTRSWPSNSVLSVSGSTRSPPATCRPHVGQPPPQVVRRSVNATPLRRAGNPDDVARLATELAHPQSFVPPDRSSRCAAGALWTAWNGRGTAS